MLHSWEQFHRVKSLLLEVLRDISCQLPNAFEDQFGNFELLRVRSGSVTREWLDYLEKKVEKCPGAEFRTLFVVDPKGIT